MARLPLEGLGMRLLGRGGGSGSILPGPFLESGFLPWAVRSGVTSISAMSRAHIRQFAPSPFPRQASVGHH